MLYFDFVFLNQEYWTGNFLTVFTAVGHSVIRGFKPQVNGYAASLVVFLRESNPIKELSTKEVLE